MPDIASTLKAEIARIARREIRTETQDLKKASAQYRAHISALRHRIEWLERELKRAGKQRTNEPVAPDTATGVTRRFSASRLAATRKKLALSAAQLGALIGVSAQSIYKWEAGEARPRAKQLESIASVRGMGKREAAAKLQVLVGAG
jgi:DNA-binding transcriptional regulator YiaG